MSDDPAIADALARATDPAVKVLSLDVFDTVVWRRVREPVDAFVLVGERLRDAGMLPAHVPPDVFAALRCRAEVQAREIEEEATLAEIYAQPALAFLDAAQRTSAAAIEVDVEAEVVMPDLDVAELVHAARAAGKRIVATSDTYLSDAHLARLLDQPPLGADAFDRILTSSDHRRNKGGGLYDLVIAEAGGDPAAVVHVGDNHDADVAAARRAGITAVHRPRRAAHLDEALDRERFHLDTPVDVPHGDFGLAHLRSRVGARAEAIAGTHADHWRYGATVLGPVLAGFGEWVQRRARELDASSVACLMREGELLSRVVATAGRGLEHPVGASPLWLSRQVVTRAALDEVTPEKLERLLQRQRPPTVAELFDTLGVRMERVPFTSPPAGARLTDRKLVDDLFAEICGSAELRGTILEQAGERRRRLVRHLERHLAPEQTRLVLVDIGWTATIQARLVDVLRLEGVPLDVVGLYLVTTGAVVDSISSGIAIDGFLAHAGEPAPAVASIIRSPEVLEQVCMCDAGSMVDVAADGEVVHGPYEEPAEQAAQRHAAQDGVLAFAEEVVRYRQAMPGRLPTLANRAAAGHLRAILTRAVTAPTPFEAELFAGWLHDENFGSAGRAELVGGGVRTMAAHLDPVSLTELPMSLVHWPFAVAALEDPQLAAAADALAMGRVPAEAVTSELESGPVEIRFEGIGPGIAARQSHPARRNRRGLSFVRAVVGNAEVRRVTIHPGQHPVVVRVDRLRVACALDGRAEPVVRSFTTVDELASLTLVGARWLSPRVLWVAGRADAIALDLAELVPGRVHQVELELAFAALPVDDDIARAARRRRVRASVTRAISIAEFRTGLPVSAVARKVALRLRAALR